MEDARCQRTDQNMMHSDNAYFQAEEEDSIEKPDQLEAGDEEEHFDQSIMRRQLTAKSSESDYMK
jgi:hypothetical protein